MYRNYILFDLTYNYLFRKFIVQNDWNNWNNWNITFKVIPEENINVLLPLRKHFFQRVLFSVSYHGRCIHGIDIVQKKSA